MKIPVYQPSFDGREREYLLEAFDSGWISSRGRFIERFERAFASYVGAERAISVANGTVALHLAMLGLGLGPGDEVIVPTFTYVASANAMAFVGATPVFVDCEPASWQLDPDQVEAAVTHRTRAIMVVHLYGHPADMGRIMEIARRRNLAVIEDAAEAFGARWNGRHVGTFGDVSTFSFFGNKTITTGEGGMVLASDGNLLDEMAKLKSQYASPTKRYWHDKVGYNFRMTNLEAAIGLAQLERADEIIGRKRALAEQYRGRLSKLGIEIQGERPGVTHSYWMVSALLPEGVDRDRVVLDLEAVGIETRPVFYPIHTMPMFASLPSAGRSFPNSVRIARSGLNLPSWPGLSENGVDEVVSALSAAIEAQ